MTNEAFILNPISTTVILLMISCPLQLQVSIVNFKCFNVITANEAPITPQTIYESQSFQKNKAPLRQLQQ